VDAARTLFARDGIEAVRINEITEAAAMTRRPLPETA